LPSISSLGFRPLCALRLAAAESEWRRRPGRERNRAIEREEGDASMLELSFERERETKNTVRYEEQVMDEPPVVGTLYLQKYALNRLGNPDRLRVTIEAAGAARLAPVAKVAEAKPRPKAEKPRKLSFKEERELEGLPELIGALEGEQEELHRTLSDPEFYRTAGAEVSRINARLAELETELAEAYRRWEELEVIRG